MRRRPSRTLKYENGTKTGQTERMDEYIESLDADARIRVRFDTSDGELVWFVAQLEHNPRPWADGDWKPVARFDHQPHLEHGHDVYEEGLHMDFHFVDGRNYHLDFGPAWLSPNLGDVLQACKRFLQEQYTRLVVDYLNCELPRRP